MLGRPPFLCSLGPSVPATPNSWTWPTLYSGWHVEFWPISSRPNASFSEETRSSVAARNEAYAVAHLRSDQFPSWTHFRAPCGQIGPAGRSAKPMPSTFDETICKPPAHRDAEHGSFERRCASQTRGSPPLVHDRMLPWTSGSSDSASHWDAQLGLDRWITSTSAANGQ